MKDILQQKNYFSILTLYTVFFLCPLFSVGQTWHEVVKLTASDGEMDDLLGFSVSISGDRAIAGSYGDDDDGSDSGSAYIFELVGGTWIEVEKLTASDAETDDHFGVSVSISGDYAFVGAFGDDDDGFQSGAVYIFELVGGIWTEVDKITASDATGGDVFGESVCISGDHAVVGARGNDDSGSQSGSAYIFELIGGAWTEVEKLTASDAAEEDFFGYSVSISGDRAIIGAYRDDDEGGGAGSAYIFEVLGGAWVEVEKLTASDGAINHFFGWTVSISGDRAIIGAYGNDDDGMYSGSAYIFELVGGLWTEVEKLTASDAAEEDFFGCSVAISGDHAIVGAYKNDDGGYDNSGSAYIFELVGGEWIELEKLTATDPGIGDQFGNEVAISGDQAIISAPRDGGAADRGSVYIFEVCEFPPTVTATSDVSDICFGDEVILSGDGAEIYTWDGDVTDGVAFAPDIGTTTYTVVGVDDVGCGSIDSIDINVNPLPLVTAMADDSEVCLGDEITLTGDGAETYVWDGDITDGEAFAPMVGTTTYTVTGTDELGCVNTATVDIIVYEAISVVYITTDEMFGGDAAINITVTGGNPTYSFDWDNDGLGDFDDDEDLIGIPAGTYIVEIMDEAGCTGTETIVVDTQLGIETIANIDVLLYPNPTVNQVVIEMDGGFDYSLQTLNGKVLLTGSALNEALLDLGEFADGVYIIQINDDKTSKSLKIIKVEAF